MNTEEDYISINRELWNTRTAVHLESGFYDMASFRNGKSSLKDIELEDLGDIRGKSLLHLQCHFGQDTLSLARMGAAVCGVDLSDKAIAAACNIAGELNIPAEFVCCDVYETSKHIEKQFDIVFTSYGAIGWLPDLNPWAKVIAERLKPGGIFLIVEFHPVLWMMDERFEQITYSYFNVAPIVETTEGTYTDRNAPIRKKSVSWNHGLAEVTEALVNNGLKLVSLKEYDYSPYDCFANTVKTEKGFMIKGMEGILPMVYSLKATK